MRNQRLTKKQLRVLDDLFGGQMDEADVLKKHNVTLSTYRRWLGYEEFVSEFNFRIESSKRQGQLIVARYVPAAAARLVELAGDDKGETSRKACLDIMSMPMVTRDNNVGEVANKAEEPVEVIDNETASRILKTLAER